MTPVMEAIKEELNKTIKMLEASPKKGFEKQHVIDILDQMDITKALIKGSAIILLSPEARKKVSEEEDEDDSGSSFAEFAKFLGMPDDLIDLIKKSKVKVVEVPFGKKDEVPDSPGAGGITDDEIK